jgi:hypothetical protein
MGTEINASESSNWFLRPRGRGGILVGAYVATSFRRVPRIPATLFATLFR